MVIFRSLSRARRGVAFAIVGVLVAACGGGGGGGATGAVKGDKSQCKTGNYDTQNYYGTYDVATKKPGHAATSLGDPKTASWLAPPQPKKAYTIGVSFPHLKDPYWLAVDYGVVAEAKCLGVGVKLVAAQGYNDLTGQINQVENLVNQGVDGIVFAAISYAGDDETIANVRTKMPILEVINDCLCAKISAKALVSFYEMGYNAGTFVANDSKDKSSVKVGFSPGPAGSGWAPDTVDGFKDAVNKLAPGKVNVVDIRWGDTGKEVQQSLIEDMLNAHPDLDYIVGTASGVDAATGVVASRAHKPKIVGTHHNPPVWDDIQSNKIAAAPTDSTALQGRMAIDMMVRILNGEKSGTDIPFRAGPIIKVMTPQNLSTFSYEDNFGPRGFQPVFTVTPGS